MDSTQKQSFFAWAYDHSKISHQKYSTTSHAAYITISGTILFLLSFLSIRYIFFPTNYLQQ